MAKIKTISTSQNPLPQRVAPPKAKTATGRPRLKVVKEDIIGFRLNTKQYDAVVFAASKTGMSPHEWCRKVILDFVFRENK